MDDRIERLPKWAQEHIANLQRERDIAVRELHAMLDNQTESAISYDDIICDGENGNSPSYVTRYVNGTNRIAFAHADVRLEVSLQDDDIRLSWGGEPRHSMKEVALIPIAFQQARLVSKENMR